MTKSRPLSFHFQFEMIYKLINQTISKNKYAFFFFFFPLVQDFQNCDIHLCNYS